MSESVRFTAAACGLAQAIHKSRVRAYDLACVDWTDLPYRDRERFVEQASDIIRANAPVELHPSLFEGFVNLTREHAKVITHPFGERD